MFLVGLTGGIATGKTTVAEIFAQNDVPVIDSDAIARQVVEPGRPAHVRLKAAFGDSYFDSYSGELLRDKLGKRVFGDDNARRQINSITHPEIRKETLRLILQYLLQGHRFVVLDMPLLFETGFDRFVQRTVVVCCSEEVQLKRLMDRNPQLSEQDALDRISSQMPLRTKLKRANYVIDNYGTFQNTTHQVENILNDLNTSWLCFGMRVGLLTLLLLFTCLLSLLINFILRR